MHLILAGLAVFVALMFVGYAAWLFLYMNRDDEAVRERLKQVTQ